MGKTAKTTGNYYYRVAQKLDHWLTAGHNGSTTLLPLKRIQ